MDVGCSVLEVGSSSCSVTGTCEAAELSASFEALCSIGSETASGAVFSSSLVGSSSIGSARSCAGVGVPSREVSPTSVKSNMDLISKDPRSLLSSGFGDCSMLLVIDVVSQSRSHSSYSSGIRCLERYRGP